VIFRTGHSSYRFPDTHLKNTFAREEPVASSILIGLTLAKAVHSNERRTKAKI